ncbi:MAG TPA: hypothetical protein VGD10_01170 [Allosphingosinicella sp.]|uniref:hypothetical protein n=1 Tax=Allosphingosinicella sp. TaxID=2823234 RepID=UPI002EDAA7D6
MSGGRSITARPRWQRRQIVRLALIVLAALFLLWLSVAVSLAGAARERHPELALRFWPIDGFAKAAKASLMITADVRKEEVAQARQLALDALRSEPMAVKGVRVAAIGAEVAGDRAAAKRQFQLSRDLSKRDLITTLWFLEEAVSRNDIPGVLRQYEIALRTSRSSQGILFPVLDGALGDDELVSSIGGLLARGHEWVPPFAEYMIKDGKQPGGFAKALLARPTSLNHLPPDYRAALLTKLVDKGELNVAERLYLRLSGSAPAAAIRNGDFSSPSVWPPFDWSLISGADYGADLAPEQGALLIYSRNGGAGTVARQILALAPGAYQLEVAGAVRSESGEGSALWSVGCIGGRSLGGIRVGAQGRRLAQRITVPAGCPRQWINLEIGSGGEGSRIDGEFDSIRLRRI